MTESVTHFSTRQFNFFRALSVTAFEFIHWLKIEF
jgi:hypothetical protein